MKDDFDVSPLKNKKKLNSRAKGNRFENKIAKQLNERFDTKEFCRTPGSGAFATTHKLPEYLKVYGDLITPEKFKFIIECKKGYNEQQVSDLFNPKSIISNMVSQADRDSRKSSRKFLLIIGQNRKDPVVITNDTEINVQGNFLKGTVNRIKISLFSFKELLRIKDSNFFLNDA